MIQFVMEVCHPAIGGRAQGLVPVGQPSQQVEAHRRVARAVFCRAR
jgi:hypothetical protein